MGRSSFWFGAASLGAVAGALAACTLTGLGNYAVATCSLADAGSTAVALTGTYPPSVTCAGDTPLATFVTGASPCVQAVDPHGYVAESCAGTPPLPAAAEPAQPWMSPVVDSTGNYVVAASTACNLDGGGASQLALALFNSVASSTSSPALGACEAAGVALPAVLSSSASHAVAAWYGTASSLRGDPIGDCVSASAAPLNLADVALPSTTSGTLTLGSVVQLAGAATSVRPPALATLNGATLVASPDGAAVSFWAFTSAASLASVGTGIAVSGLAKARSAAIATDGSSRVAIVSELGCAPQTIALALGSLSGGFVTMTVVTATGQEYAVDPTVAWFPPAPGLQGQWIVGWIGGPPGATHAFAQAFDVKGNKLGAVTEPPGAAVAGCVSVNGNASSGYTAGLFAYGAGTFTNLLLGCGQE